MTKIKYIRSGKTFEVTYESGDTILDAALRNDIDAPYSCMEGVCGSCLARIEGGEAESRDDMVLSEAELAAKKVLTCQSKPKPGCELLVVNYDNV